MQIYLEQVSEYPKSMIWTYQCTSVHKPIYQHKELDFRKIETLSPFSKVLAFKTQKRMMIQGKFADFI